MPGNARLILLTFLTMIAFAANSVLCRLALVDSANDPISFTLIRLLSGAFVLAFFIRKTNYESFKPAKRKLLAPLMLFSYALFFSLSYVQIGAGTGALLLFSSVQLTMMIVFLLRGQKLNKKETVGFALAAIGFVYLLWPGLHMPPPSATLMMGLSGVSWGIYTLVGQGTENPIVATARNFIFTSPLVLLVIFFNSITLTPAGLKLAVISGALTSALGYILWYVVLKKLQTSTAAIVQLSVPALAAIGGVILLGENLHLRLFIASMLIFSGIFIKVKSAAKIVK